MDQVNAKLIAVRRFSSQYQTELDDGRVDSWF